MNGYNNDGMMKFGDVPSRPLQKITEFINHLFAENDLIHHNSSFCY